MKNRVIKFRVWDGEKMYTFDNHAYDLIYNDICGWGIAPNTPNYKGPWLAGDSSDKHDESVMMQYIGLKDKHGKEIYEGDIITYDLAEGLDQPEKKNLKEVVKISAYGAVSIYYQNIKVIGNIYENPELCQ